MGANIVEKYLDKESFLNRNMLYKVQTVFPTTTTAALTAIQNGKSPNENAWLAWTQYVKEVDDIVVPFQNKGFYNEKQYENGLFKKLVPVSTTVEELNEKGIKASNILPNFDDENRHSFVIPNFGKTKNATLEGFCQQILDNDKNSDDQYIFCYYDSLDHIMHKTGPSSDMSKGLLKNINDCLEELSKELSDDSMMVIVADHGQIDVNKNSFIELKGTNYENYLKRYTHLDPRAVGLDIKEEYKEQFEKEFIDDFEDDFVLLNKQQILDTKLFGYTENHPKLMDFLPDYVAIGKTNKLMYTVLPEQEYRGHHTGIHDDEVFVPVIVYKKTKLDA